MTALSHSFLLMVPLTSCKSCWVQLLICCTEVYCVLELLLFCVHQCGTRNFGKCTARLPHLSICASNQLCKHVQTNGFMSYRTYRLSQNVKPLIWVECLVEKHSRSRTEYMVKARSQFKERSSATNVEILLPLPPDAITPNVRTSQVSLPDHSKSVS